MRADSEVPISWCGLPGWISPSTSSDSKRSPGHLSRQGSPELRWAAFEAARCAARRGSPDYAYYHRQAAKRDGHNGKNPTLAVERKILRRCYHTLRDLGDAALALPDTRPQRRWPLNNALCACPAHISADASGRLPQSPVAASLLGGLPGENEPPHPFGGPHAGHPIHYHVAGPLSVDPDKFFGPLRGRPRMRENRVRSLAEVDPAWRSEPEEKFDPGADGGAAHCCYEHEGPTLFHPVRFLRATASL